MKSALEPAADQAHQPIFIRLLQTVIKLNGAHWLTAAETKSTRNCIKVLHNISKNRKIVLPAELENQIGVCTYGLHSKPAPKQPLLLPPRSDEQDEPLSFQLQHLQQHQQQQSLLLSDKSIIEKLQGIVESIEVQFRPLIQAELSVLVDILFKPEFLFPEGTAARKKCSNGGFIRKLICQTENLVDDQDDKLCVKILETIKSMMELDPIFERKVSTSAV